MNPYRRTRRSATRAAILAFTITLGLGATSCSGDDATQNVTSTTNAPPAPTTEPGSATRAPLTTLSTTTLPATTTPATTSPATAPPTPPPPTSPPSGATMPDVVGMNLQAAQDLIQESGVFFSRSFDCSGAGRRQVLDRNWVVVTQTPSPGSPIGEGDARLGVVKVDEPRTCV